METTLILILIVIILAWAINVYNLNQQIKKLKAENVKIIRENKELLFNIQELSRFQEVLDTEKACNEMVKNAKAEAELLAYNAKAELEGAKNTAKEMKSTALAEAQTIRVKAQQFLTNANNEASAIINNSKVKAQEIAGDAYTAMENAAEFEKTAKAMKNIIEGYGDEYIKPSYSLLDDLAKEFGFTEAGEKLKFTREKTNLMVKDGTAAKCDYVEANRKETAIRFVVDAFNGKVDSILSQVKKDNFGKLEQKILDSYQTVNFNGRAFRNAEITEEYLNSRMDELKWAVILQELKWQDQEEQRRIKEQIREEEKARREYERAIKDAQKEEETLKKLIEKAQKEVAQATDEQKAKYEEKLRELEAKLIEAEAKNQKALSMAQQTKSGNVYIISNIGSFGEDVFKIGMTRRLEPLDRIKELGDASVPFEFDVHALIYSEDAPKLENELHKKFIINQMNKVNPRKEFFKVNLIEIKNEIDKLGIETKWTMAAEAKQYKESLAIEQTISTDRKKKEEWERFQLQFDERQILIPEEIDEN